MEGWPEPAEWWMQMDNEARRFADERRIAKMEADWAIMKLWPEYNPKGETDEHQRSVPEQIP